jgi:hypothetical protein
MNFYEDIAHRLYVWNTKIGETDFRPFQFIEAKHNEAPFKGEVFYRNLMQAMPNHFGSKLRSDFFKKVLEYCQQKIDAIEAPRQTETKTDKLKAELSKYGFFELPKVKQLSEPNKQRLIELISTNDLPYSIAMVEYLGFIKHLKVEHFTTDYKLFKEVANWFEVAERAVKGNIYVLNEFSKENRTRYTADQQKQTVQKNYEALK